MKSDQRNGPVPAEHPKRSSAAESIEVESGLGQEPVEEAAPATHGNTLVVRGPSMPHCVRKLGILAGLRLAKVIRSYPQHCPDLLNDRDQFGSWPPPGGAAVEIVDPDASPAG